MSNVFDEIATNEPLELKVASVEIKGPGDKKYHFTVTELTPAEMTLCVDEFGDINFLAVIYRTVRDQDGRRMTKQQANRLSPEIMAKFIDAYNTLLTGDKKKSSKKKIKA